MANTKLPGVMDTGYYLTDEMYEHICEMIDILKVNATMGRFLDYADTIRKLVEAYDKHERMEREDI